MVASWAKEPLVAGEPHLDPESIRALDETRGILDTMDRMRTIEQWASAHRNVTADICGNLHGEAPPKPPFHAVLDEMRAIHDAKNRDYSDSTVDAYKNFRGSERIGVPAHRGCFIRLQDKVERIENLLKREGASGEGPAVATETVEDTLLDLANYAVITLILRRQYKERGK